MLSLGFFGVDYYMDNIVDKFFEFLGQEHNRFFNRLGIKSASWDELLAIAADLVFKRKYNFPAEIFKNLPNYKRFRAIKGYNGLNDFYQNIVAYGIAYLIICGDLASLKIVFDEEKDNNVALFKYVASVFFKTVLKDAPIYFVDAKIELPLMHTVPPKWLNLRDRAVLNQGILILSDAIAQEIECSYVVFRFSNSALEIITNRSSSGGYTKLAIFDLDNASDQIEADAVYFEGDTEGNDFEMKLINLRRNLIINVLAYLETYGFTEELLNPLEYGIRNNSRRSRRKLAKLQSQLNPRWIGKDYQPRKSSDSGETHASPVEHWRQGHWRQQVCGEGFKDRKLIWIRPVFVNGRVIS